MRQVGESHLRDVPNIIQYNLNAYDSASIATSATVIGTSPEGNWLGALQMGPDNKIYCIIEQLDTLAVINTPDIQGSGCGFRYDQVSLSGRQGIRGLPVFFPSLITNQNVDFTFSIAKNCSNVNFAGMSSVSGRLTWNWDFGDGSTAIGQNVSHAYVDGANTDTVRLVVTAPSDCGIATVKATKVINLTRTIPLAKFGYSLQCGNPSVTFSDSTTLTGSTIQGWLWNFGDGTTSTLQNPVHTFNGYGNYVVKLSVTSNGNCNGTDIATTTLPIEAKPVADYSDSKTCVNTPANFTDLSSIAFGSINTWYWDFGDGTNSISRNPSKIYALAGPYDVKLVVKSASGCISDTVSKVILAGDIPSAVFSVTDTCFGTSTKFAANANLKSGSIAGWWWNFGNGNYATVQNVSDSFANPGKYFVQMVATANTGCQSDTVSRIVTIGSKPVPDFLFTGECGQPNVSFIDQSKNKNEAITKWHWNFGDGSHADLQNPAYTYRNFGTYNVALVVTSSLGCSSDTVTKSVGVYAKPLAKFSFNNGCTDQLMTFTDSSGAEDGSSIVKWYWDFGNGKTSNRQFPSEAYTSYGNYQVRLAVSSDKGCLSDTVSQILSIDSKPIASFSVNNGCTNRTLAIINSSSIANGSIEKYHWDFGDGNISNLMQPVYSYSHNGDYFIKQVVISKNGCISDTAFQQVSIETVPNLDFGFGNTCAGKQIDFANLSNNFPVSTSWTWNFGDGQISHLFQPSYSYEQFGTYTISLTAYTQNKCDTTVSKSIVVSKVDVSAGNDTTIAIEQPLQLVASGAKEYFWSPSFGLSDAKSNHPIAILSGDMTYYLTGITAEGCLGYDTVHVKVYKGPNIYCPNAFTPNNDGLNDILKPTYAGISELYFFSVYNRWGQLVFTTNKIGDGWNGKSRGFEQPSDTYVWILKAKDYLGQLIIKKGTVILIR
ncbi:MAG: PKD domain-containing protein [Ginsengibacter sp.]